MLFAYNRKGTLQQTVESLLQNEESAESDLYVYVDGPRTSVDGDEVKVREVCDYVRQIQGFRTVHVNESETNRGLGPSIIRGVTEIISRYGRAIVLEDDLVCTSNFLSYMNEALDTLEQNSKVFSVCGYSNAIRKPKDYPYDYYYCPRASSWGWGTWKDRWESVDWNLDDWNEVKAGRRAFNRWGGSDCFGMLQNWKEGKNQSWAIRFCYSQFVQDKVSLFPVYSKIGNNGFDGNGTNCRKWSRFRCETDGVCSKEYVFPKNTDVNRLIVKSALSYHSLPMRAFSRIMYLISR